MLSILILQIIFLPSVITVKVVNPYHKIEKWKDKNICISTATGGTGL
jgi:hypothetical protein